MTSNKIEKVWAFVSYDPEIKGESIIVHDVNGKCIIMATSNKELMMCMKALIKDRNKKATLIEFSNRKELEEFG